MTAVVASPLRDELFRNGYVVVPDVIDPIEVLQPVLEEYAGVLDELAADLAARGQMGSTYADLPLEARLIQIAKESGSTHTQHFDITLPHVSLDLHYQPTGQPSGREQFPSFVVRSQAHPELVTTQPTEWRDGWLEARSRLAQDDVPAFNRWDPNSPLCA